MWRNGFRAVGRVDVDKKKVCGRAVSVALVRENLGELERGRGIAALSLLEHAEALVVLARAVGYAGVEDLEALVGKVEQAVCSRRRLVTVEMRT